MTRTRRRQVTGAVVYGHYGRREDLVRLQALRIPVKGALLLLRHGKIHDGAKVGWGTHNAEAGGAAGVLLYPDPQDFAGVGGRFPNGTGLPRDGVLWSSLNAVPETPPRPPAQPLPRLQGPAPPRPPPHPAQTLSAEAAARVQELMGGPECPRGGGAAWAPTAWAGLGRGPGVVNVTLAVSNIVYQETLRNVHAALPAADNAKFVMLGCHYGSLYTEPAAGMAGLLAISEAVGKAFPLGTQRKVIFSAWAAGEYGMIGSTEFAQDELGIF
nr:transferrin receptor protein 2-like [Penaeus vannamei]